MKRMIVAVSAWSLSLAVLAAAQENVPAPPEQKTVEVLGARIRYYELGPPGAPTLLILHGLGDRSRNHLRSALGLARTFHVLVPDQIGHGLSDKPRLTYRIRTFSDFDAGFLKAVGVSRAHVTGASLGGWIGADLAIRYPQLVDRLVLVDSAGVRPPGRKLNREDIPRELYATSLSDQRKILERVFLDKATISDAMVEAAFRDHVRDGDGGTIESILEGIVTDEEPLDTRAAQIKAPTLIVWCRQDALLPVQAADVLKAAIPGSSLVLLDGCGHVPDAERTDEYNAAVLNFLGR
jgi:2-hydroxy-6-oxonona-2,4-dienedioate hydrolase